MEMPQQLSNAKGEGIEDMQIDDTGENTSLIEMPLPLPFRLTPTRERAKDIQMDDTGKNTFTLRQLPMKSLKDVPLDDTWHKIPMTLPQQPSIATTESPEDIQLDDIWHMDPWHITCFELKRQKRVLTYSRCYPKKKQSMIEEACPPPEEAKEEEMMDVLCMVTGRKILGIDLSKLREGSEEVKNVDWESISPAPLLFSFDLRGGDNIDDPYPLGLRHFVLDSNIYMVGGFHPFDEDMHASDYFLCEVGDPCSDIYEIEFDEFGRFLLSKTDSVLSPPGPLTGSRVANILGDIYFIQHHRLIDKEDYGLLLLDSRDKQWKQLPPPPPLGWENLMYYAESFVLHNKLFLQCFLSRTDYNRPFFSFDPKTKCWTKEHYEDDSHHILHSFRLKVVDELHFFFPRITVSVPNLSNDSNHSIMLGFSYYEDHRLKKARICALLVNHNVVLCYQTLEEPFERIQPSFTGYPTCILIDLGSSTVCALLCGRVRAMGCKRRVLCISVFTLAKAPHPDTYTDFNIDPASPKEQRFLSVRVLGNHVYDFDEGDIREAFVFPPQMNAKLFEKRKKLRH